MAATELALINGEVAPAEDRVREIPAAQVDLLKRTICKGASDDELAFFLAQCRRTGLDPFLKQIYCLARWDGRLKREVYTTQIGIDGLRLLADRTGKYVPGREPTIEADANGRIIKATAYIKKLRHGEWHEVAATAYYEEYVQTDRDGNPNSMWRKMPRSQLCKCAESLALRRAFPAELSGLYSPEEMGQSENESPAPPLPPPARVPRKAQLAEHARATLAAKAESQATPDVIDAPVMTPRQQSESEYSDLWIEAEEIGVWDMPGVDLSDLHDLKFAQVDDAALVAAREKLSAMIKYRHNEILDSDPETPVQNAAAQRAEPATPAPQPAADQNACAECGRPLTPAQVSLSNRHFGKGLCPEHQRGKQMLG